MCPEACPETGVVTHVFRDHRRCSYCAVCRTAPAGIQRCWSRPPAHGFPAADGKLDVLTRIRGLTRAWLSGVSGVEFSEGVAAWPAGGIEPGGWDEFGDAVRGHLD